MKLNRLVIESGVTAYNESAAAAVAIRHRITDWISLTEWARTEYPGPDWSSDGTFSAWEVIASVIRSGRYQCAVEPTEHELRMGGVRRDDVKHPVSTAVTAQDLSAADAKDGIAPGSHFNFLAVGWAAKRAGGKFPGMTPAIVGSIDGFSPATIHYKLMFWWPDFKYMNEYRRKKAEAD